MVEQEGRNFFQQANFSCIGILSLIGCNKINIPKIFLAPMDSSFIAKFIRNGTQNLVPGVPKRYIILPGRPVCQLKYPVISQFSVMSDLPRANVYVDHLCLSAYAYASWGKLLLSHILGQSW